MHDGLINALGIAGGLLFLLAFWRTSIGKWKGTSFWYEFDNLLGAICLSFYAYAKGAYVNILLNLVWGIVAFRGVSSYAERRMGRQRKLAARNTKKRST